MLISGKIERIINIKTRTEHLGGDNSYTFHDGPTWEETLRAPYIMDLPGGDTVQLSGWCLLGRGHFVHLTWHFLLEDTSCTLHDEQTWKGTLCAPYMMELPEGDTSCTLYDGATWNNFLREYGDTSYTLYDGATWRGHFVHVI